jgi:hypothetical protein
MKGFRQDKKVDSLKRAPLFAGLSRKELVQVARLTDDLEVAQGRVLCKEGRSAKNSSFWLRAKSMFRGKAGASPR